TVLEIDSAKLIPNADEIAEQLPFMGVPDKAGSAYLRSALLAVINHFKAGPTEVSAGAVLLQESVARRVAMVAGAAGRGAFGKSSRSDRRNGFARRLQ